MHERIRASAAILAAALLCILVAGCAVDTERLKAFLREPRQPVSGVAYRILPPDTLTFRSFYVPEINNITQQVRPDGKVNLPLVGEIYVAGKTALEVQAEIEEAAKKYYEEVDATVLVTGFNSQRIFVFGQVARRGPQAWTGRNTLLDVLADSQPTELAWPERIIVVRGALPQRGGYLPDDLDRLVKEAEAAEAAAAEAEAANAAHGADAAEVLAKVAPKQSAAAPKEGEAAPAEGVAAADQIASAKPPGNPKARVMRFDMMKMVKKGDMCQNVYLEPDDVIYVPANPLAAVGLAIQQVLLPIRPAAETVSVPASAARTATMGGGY